MNVRTLKDKDILSILALEKKRIGDSLGQEELSKALKKEGYLCLVLVEEKDEAKGYILCSVNGSEAEIYSIAIPTEFEGKGYGRLLLESLENRLKEQGITKVLLEVDEKNTKAKRLYEKNGFITYRIRKAYYKQDNALCMFKEI